MRLISFKNTLILLSALFYTAILASCATNQYSQPKMTNEFIERTKKYAQDTLKEHYQSPIESQASAGFALDDTLTIGSVE